MFSMLLKNLPSAHPILAGAGSAREIQSLTVVLPVITYTDYISRLKDTAAAWITLGWAVAMPQGTLSARSRQLNFSSGHPCPNL